MENTPILKQGILYASSQDFPSMSVLDSGVQHDKLGAVNEVETEPNPITDCFSQRISPTYGLHVRSAKCYDNQSFLQM